MRYGRITRADLEALRTCVGVADPEDGADCDSTEAKTVAKAFAAITRIEAVITGDMEVYIIPTYVANIIVSSNDHEVTTK